MSERKLRRMSRTELIDVIDTLRQEETPQETEALRRVDAERERLTERRRFWRVLRGTVSTLIVVAAIAVLLATLLLIWLLVTTRKRPKAGKHEKTTRGDPHETNS